METAVRPVPAAIGLCTLVLSVATLLQALGMAAFALLAISKPIWILFGFEVVVMVAAVIGILLAKGRFSQGQGLAAASVAGTIAVASFLAWLTTSKIAIPLTSAPTIIRAYILTRLAVGAWFSLLGAYMVLSRHPASLKFLRDAMLTGTPLALILGALAKFQVQFQAWLASTSGAVQSLIVLALFAACCVLIALCGHSLIRAFEMGRHPPAGAYRSNKAAAADHRVNS